MKTKLFFVEDNGGYMLASLHEDGEFFYLDESIKCPFPDLTGDLLEEEKIKKAKEFLQAVEDDSSWNSELTFDEFFCDGIEIIAEIEKEL